MSTGTFSVTTASQVTFLVNDITLSTILAALTTAGVNIQAFVSISTKKCLKLVKIVPGTSDGQTAADIQQLTQVLDTHFIRFSLDNVTIATFSDSDALNLALQLVQSTLYCRVVINSIYSTFFGDIVIDASNIATVQAVLGNLAGNPPCAIPTLFEVPCQTCHHS